MNTKRLKTITSFGGILTIFLLFLIANPLFAQDPPPPPPGGQSGNHVPGGGAPIGNGMLLLIVFGSAYGYYKVKDNRCNNPISSQTKGK